MSDSDSYLQKRIRSFGHAFRGIRTLIATQPHARIHLLATALVLGLGIGFSLSWGEWAILCLAMGMVWAAEGFNTALEFLADRVSTEHHPLTGKAKDVAAGAVLLAAIFAAAVAACVFIPRIFG